MKKQSIILSLCLVCALFATKGMAQNNLVLREDNIEGPTMSRSTWSCRFPQKLHRRFLWSSFFAI